MYWGTPPWRFFQTCTAAELELQRYVKAVSPSAAQPVQVEYQVEAPTGSAGLWVKGSVRALLQLHCEWCGQPYVRPVEAKFKTWLNGLVESEAEISSADELAFPQTHEICDLSPAVVDAISLALPPLCLCGAGGEQCERAESGAVQLQSSSSRRNSKRPSSPFAALLSKAKAGGAATPTAESKQGKKRKS